MIRLAEYEANVKKRKEGDRETVVSTNVMSDAMESIPSVSMLEHLSHPDTE